MKLTRTFLVAILFPSLIFNEAEAQSVEDSVAISEETILVIFECNSCTEKNKFYVSGPEEHTFRKLEFPFKQELKPGDYEMTYWQNKVQQIQLPFSVNPGSENVIIVKE